MPDQDISKPELILINLQFHNPKGKTAQIFISTAIAGHIDIKTGTLRLINNINVLK